MISSLLFAALSPLIGLIADTAGLPYALQLLGCGVALVGGCVFFRRPKRGRACGISFLLFLTALTVVEPGKAISLRNASVIFGAALSLLTGEHLRSIQWLGVALVTFGVCGFL